MARKYYLTMQIVLDYESNPEVGPDEVGTQLQRFVNKDVIRDFTEYADWQEGGQTVFEVSLFESGPVPEEFRLWLEDICD